MHLRLEILKCAPPDLREKLFSALDRYKDALPAARDAKILIKPNLNNHMNALTGNTTDLRILGALLQYLKEEGYSNIVIAEGSNSGFFRTGIAVATRLRVDALAKYYGVEFRDLNRARPYEIRLEGDARARIAAECVEADFLINLPKLKTHAEMGMSVCLKNLIGCLVGEKNKKKAHRSLAANILRLNEIIKPRLHIVDALIAMEGFGPARGTPVRLDTILMGTDPYLLDLVCARIAGFDPKRVATLDLAEKKGLLRSEHHHFADGLNPKWTCKDLEPPRPGVAVRVIHNPKRQKYFMAIRNTAIFTYLAGTEWFGALLYALGLRQDVFIKEEMEFVGLKLARERCVDCGLCAAYCPQGRLLPDCLDAYDFENCLGCLYCYSICPRSAIEFKGRLGFFAEQLRQYDHLIRNLHEEGNGASHAKDPGSGAPGF